MFWENDMRPMPNLEIGWMNGWVFLGLYYLALIITAISFSTEKRKKLFYEPDPTKRSSWRAATAVGQVASVVFNLLMIWSPLQIGTPSFTAGSIIYLLGYTFVMVSLVNFKRTPVDEMVSRGLYRFSRNPQWVGLVLVFLGTALAAATWLHLGLVLILVVTHHFQILAEEKACEGFYGEAYRDYMNRLPRYLICR
jgi:protein-S-isoprenylcysteine O-methyltransferase Ste14